MFPIHIALLLLKSSWILQIILILSFIILFFLFLTQMIWNMWAWNFSRYRYFNSIFIYFKFRTTILTYHLIHFKPYSLHLSPVFRDTYLKEQRFTLRKGNEIGIPYFLISSKVLWAIWDKAPSYLDICIKPSINIFFCFVSFSISWFKSLILIINSWFKFIYSSFKESHRSFTNFGLLILLFFKTCLIVFFM